MKEYAKCLYYENACFDNPIVTVRDGQNRKHLTLEEVVDKLNEQQATINKLKSDIEETEISIKLFEDDIATKDKKIEEQQAIMTKLRNENIILKNKIEDLRVSLFIQDQVLQRQIQKSDLDE